MIKKISAALLSIVVILVLSSCGSTQESATQETKALYDENGFLISSNEFMELLDTTLQKLNDEDNNYSLSKDNYPSTSEIPILLNGKESFVYLSLDQNENLEANMKEATVYLKTDKLLGNNTSYRTTIIKIIGAVPLTLDDTITDFDQAHAFIIDLFNNVTEEDFSKRATEGKHKFKSGSLPYSFIKNGLTYTLYENSENLCFTVSVGNPTIPVAKPLEESDLILQAEADGDTNVLQLIKDEWEILEWFYDPNVDESKESVLTTARGIHIGDSKEAVERAYGKDYVFHDSIENTLYIEEEYKQLFNTTALTHIHYFTEEGYGLTFCFDENDEVSWVIFSHPSIADQMK